jgi:hypothetical protein
MYNSPFANIGLTIEYRIRTFILIEIWNNSMLIKQSFNLCLKRIFQIIKYLAHYIYIINNYN